MGNPRDILHPDATYHIYNHAVGDEDIFRNEENYNFFLRKIDERITPFTDVFAYCLMKNHFHLLLRIKSIAVLRDLMGERLHRKKMSLKIKKQEIQPDLKLLNELTVEQFSHFFNSYVQSYNKFYGRQGTLLKQSFQRKRIDSREYMIKVICYIHNNPVNDGFVAKREDWKYSSYTALISERRTKIMKKEVLELFGGRENFIKVHNKQMEVGI